MSSIPSNLATLIPQSAAFSPATWNLSALNSFVNFYSQNFNQSGWKIDVPRPEVALWSGYLETEEAERQLRPALGRRFGVFSPPNVPETTININNGTQTGDFGYKDNIHDHLDFAPRGGFAYEVNPTFVIRGGSGLYYSTPYSNLSYSQQVFSETITGSFTPPAGASAGRVALHREPDLRRHGRRGLRGHRAAAGAVAAHHQPRLQESLYLAEQPRLPEAAE